MALTKLTQVRGSIISYIRDLFTIKVSSVSKLSTAGLKEGQSVKLIGYHANSTFGGGTGVIKLARHNGGTAISLTRSFPTDWTNPAQLVAWFADSESDELCFVRTDETGESLISRYGALTSINDNYYSIKKCLDDNNFVVNNFWGIIKTSGDFNLRLGQTFKGLGLVTDLHFTTENSAGITSDSAARNTVISDMQISYRFSGGGTSAGDGIAPNASNGGQGHSYKNLNINNFRYGLNVAEVWWGNTVENVRCNDCTRSLNAVNSGGLTIQNTFINFYSSNPTEFGVFLTNCKGFRFVTPNFGLRPNQESRYMIVGGASFGITVDSPNFEAGENATLPDTGGGVVVESNAQATIISPTFIKNGGTAGVAYEIMASGSAKLTLINPWYFNQQGNIGKAAVKGSAVLDIIGGDQEALDLTRPGTETAQLNQVSIQAEFGYTAGGTIASFTSGNGISIGSAYVPRNYDVKVINPTDAVQNLTAQVTALGTGSIKVRIYDMSTNAEHFSPVSLYWRAG